MVKVDQHIFPLEDLSPPYSRTIFYFPHPSARHIPSLCQNPHTPLSVDMVASTCPCSIATVTSESLIRARPPPLTDHLGQQTLVQLTLYNPMPTFLSNDLISNVSLHFLYIEPYNRYYKPVVEYHFY